MAIYQNKFQEFISALLANYAYYTRISIIVGACLVKNRLINRSISFYDQRSHDKVTRSVEKVVGLNDLASDDGLACCPKYPLEPIITDLSLETAIVIDERIYSDRRTGENDDLHSIKSWSDFDKITILESVIISSDETQSNDQTPTKKVSKHRLRFRKMMRNLKKTFTCCYKSDDIVEL